MSSSANLLFSTPAALSRRLQTIPYTVRRRPVSRLINWTQHTVRNREFSSSRNEKGLISAPNLFSSRTSPFSPLSPFRKCTCVCGIKFNAEHCSRNSSERTQHVQEDAGTSSRKFLILRKVIIVCLKCHVTNGPCSRYLPRTCDIQLKQLRQQPAGLPTLLRTESSRPVLPGT